MPELRIHLFSYNSDNYGVLIHCNESGLTAAVDAGDGNALLRELDVKGWKLSHLFITHHHADHTAGIDVVKTKTGCQVIGPKERSQPITGLDIHVDGGDTFDFAGREVNVLFTPGHTTDMVNFHIPAEKLVFTGDTLFALGCGRIFEGTPAMMWESLQVFLALPENTLVYCGHEYTQANAAFALSVDPDNKMLRERSNEITKMREQNKPTVPSLLGIEHDTNPFLRPHDPAIRKQLGMEDASDEAVFTEIRKRKDNF